MGIEGMLFITIIVVAVAIGAFAYIVDCYWRPVEPGTVIVIGTVAGIVTWLIA